MLTIHIRINLVVKAGEYALFGMKAELVGLVPLQVNDLRNVVNHIWPRGQGEIIVAAFCRIVITDLKQFDLMVGPVAFPGLYVLPFGIVIKTIKRVIRGRKLVGLKTAVHQQITGRPRGLGGRGAV